MAALPGALRAQRAGAVRCSKFAALPSLAVLLFCMARFHNLPPLTECLAIVVLIAVTVLHPASIASRLLDFRPLATLGVISYSVYLWQQLFLGTSLWLWLVLTTIMAAGSYVYIEKPSVALGHRLTARRGSLRAARPALEPA